MDQRRCSKCSQVKDACDFYRDGKKIERRCKECRRAASRDRVRAGRTSLGWTNRMVEYLLKLQGGTCAICNREIESAPHLDHCHAGGNVRGVLCQACNRGLGLFRDDPGTLSRAAIYVQRKGGPLAYIAETKIRASAP